MKAILTSSDVYKYYMFYPKSVTSLLRNYNLHKKHIKYIKPSEKNFWREFNIFHFLEMVYVQPSGMIDQFSDTEFVKSRIKYTIDFSFSIGGGESYLVIGMC